MTYGYYYDGLQYIELMAKSFEICEEFLAHLVRSGGSVGTFN
jgi:hypothetical protein